MESSAQPQVNASDQVNGVEEPVDPIENFSKELEDIINTYGSAHSLMEEQISILEKYEEKMNEETSIQDTAKDVETSSSSENEQTSQGLDKDASLLLQSLNNLSSPEEKLEAVLRKYDEILEKHRCDQALLKSLQKRQSLLDKQREQLQFEHSHGMLARSKLESLCHEINKHNKILKEDMLQKCQEDERKRAEITNHFQSTLVDIQAQIDKHSSHNNKLCQENNELANKLKSIIEQYEKREESLEKIFKQKNLQQQLSDAKLEEANMRLKEAEEKHKREKEYLLKEAIEKTKKCFTMKEQELHMKKQLLTQAAEWKLQSKELKEQNTVMQAQLVLYSQKFDEFQATLAKSNDVYATFKAEMDKMNNKMQKLEKESGLWKIRFESCNKALTDMIAERAEKGKELELFTLKIDKLETLCRALQEERNVLYSKIKDIRLQTPNLSAPLEDICEEEIPKLAQLPEPDPVHNPALTVEMEKLWKEQARLQEFAAALMASTADDKGDSENEHESPDPAPPVLVNNIPPTPTVNVNSITEEQSPEECAEEVVTEEASKSTPTVLEQAKAVAIQPEAKEESNQQDTTKPETPKEEPSNPEDIANVQQLKECTDCRNPETDVKPKEEKIDQPGTPKLDSHKEELHTEQEHPDSPRAESTKEVSSAAEPTKTESVKSESSKAAPGKAECPAPTVPKTEAAKLKNSKSQEAKPKSSKPQTKTQGSSKRKSTVKNAKKS